MSATILKFPNKQNKDKQTTLRLPLYTDVEIETVMVCVNVFSLNEKIDTQTSLTGLDPHIVVKYLNLAAESSIFSNEFKSVVQTILDNIEILECT